MAKKKKETKKRDRTNLEVAHKVEHEGLGYAIQHYMGSDDFVDLELAKLWTEAKVLLKKIDAILQEAMDQEAEM
jgi:hypothetical protein